MTLTIGQSLTPEQVRSLPDGAKVLLDWGIMYKDVFTAPIQNTMTGENGRIAVMLLSIAGWHSATLVSLPTAELQPDPSPGEGYMWVEAGKNLRHGDEWKMTDGPWILWTVDCGDVSDGTYRRRIEPQAESPSVVPLLFNPTTPRAAGEIERECALHALAVLLDDCHDAMTDAMAERDYDYLHDFMTAVEGTFRRYREVYDYARSIGAIE